MAEGDPTDESTPPVVLCCATPDEGTARLAADALLSRGHQVELVIGVEESHTELEAAIARCEAQGLYVLCRSGALPRSTIDELRAVLRAHEVPFGRTLTLAVEAKRPRALEERIVSVLRRMVTGRPDKGGSKRPTVSYSAPAPVSRPPAPGGIGDPPEHGVDAPSEPNAVDSDEIDAWADSLVGPVPTDPNANKAAEPGDAKKDPRTFTAPAPDYQPALSTEVASVDIPPPDDAPVRDGNTVKQKVLELPRTEPPPVASLPSAPPARPSPAAATSNPNLASPSMSGPMLGESPSGTPDDDDLDSAITVGGPLTRALGGPRGLMLVLGGVAALIVVFAIVVFATRDDETDKPDKVAANSKKSDSKDDKGDKGDKGDKAEADDGKADDGEAEAGKDDDGEAPADDGEPAVDDAGDAGDDGGEPAVDDAAAVDDGGDDGGDDGEDPIAAAAPPREPPIGDHYEAPDEPPPPPDEPVASGAGDAPDVVAALRSREVRALDLFVVAPEDSDNLDHAAAMAYCDAMRIAGLTGWRVPKLGELNSIVAAGMTGKGIYWSDTLGDAFGDTRIIVNAKRDRMGAASLGFEGARVLCIRDRR